MVKYETTFKLKNGFCLQLRDGREVDAEAVWKVFTRTHAETDYLLTYPDENTFQTEQEAAFLKEKMESENEIEILALIDGKIVGSAGIESIGRKDKVKHRAEYGISILKEYWGLGIGRALTQSCIECAKEAGYVQLELTVVADNVRAKKMYESFGFVEFGRNPKGFCSRTAGYQEIVLMRLEL